VRNLDALHLGNLIYHVPNQVMAKTNAEVSAIVEEGQQEARAIEESTEAEAAKVSSQSPAYTWKKNYIWKNEGVFELSVSSTDPHTHASTAP
jgi:hypothetical protein